ncbi:hypothetical protein HanXRQr2_Chr11g0483961 [Helianthus annuus]|uniref:Uncharacterized protein n=1 Tax=Helianthus annuus TaxID=4232 RepID=A0A9K3MZG3_HELAN|nr:hypothetical protein HanXRQr2_Chr11g0483961 [Helianthus annuus]
MCISDYYNLIMFVLEELCKWLELTGFYLMMNLSCWFVSNSLKCSIKLYTRRFLLLILMFICYDYKILYSLFKECLTDRLVSDRFNVIVQDYFLNVMIVLYFFSCARDIFLVLKSCALVFCQNLYRL